MKDITEELRGKLGFGCMRLPMADGNVDIQEFSRMVDAYLAAGFDYFDTAHGYIEGKASWPCGNVSPAAIPETNTFWWTSSAAAF